MHCPLGARLWPAPLHLRPCAPAQPWRWYGSVLQPQPASGRQQGFLSAPEAAAGDVAKRARCRLRAGRAVRLRLQAEGASRPSYLISCMLHHLKDNPG